MWICNKCATQTFGEGFKHSGRLGPDDCSCESCERPMKPSELYEVQSDDFHARAKTLRDVARIIRSRLSEPITESRVGKQVGTHTLTTPNLNNDCFPITQRAPDRANAMAMNFYTAYRLEPTTTEELNQSQKVSDQTLLSDADLDMEEENEIMMREEVEVPIPKLPDGWMESGAPHKMMCENARNWVSIHEDGHLMLTVNGVSDDEVFQVIQYLRWSMKQM